MNVYVRSLGSALARAGIACDVYTRRTHRAQPAERVVETGLRVLHVSAGPPEPVAKSDLHELTDDFEAEAVRLLDQAPVDALHANYWLSGSVAHRLKHRLALPLVSTFHTLARVKADAGVHDDVDRRGHIEQEVVACSDLMLASTDDERRQLGSLYGGDAARIEVVPPGVDHGVFTPQGRNVAKSRLGLDGRRVLLFAGRIQPLKGADLAVRTVAALDRSDVVLLVVGGPSGADGRAELAALHTLADELGTRDRVRFLAAQPHRRLGALYRAADVCLVPSRTESFGLVALEAAACGTPVVAAAVGGLCQLVDDTRTGFLVEGREPADYAAPVASLLDSPELARQMSVRAVLGSRRYSWGLAAARLRRLYGDVVARALVRCV
jgi:D-inositol-3-phosphate glycosyltransferase